MRKLRNGSNYLFLDFFNSERAGGLLLILCTIIALTLSNTFLGSTYPEFWQREIGEHSLIHWINDGLMAIFFLMVGLELEREIYAGALSKPKDALLPIVAAMGGMLIPALVHFYFNHNTNTQSGIGIPTATDIAFSLGVLSLFGKRIPFGLKIFLTALAIADDLGAILVIALFYSAGIDWFYLSLSLSVFAILLLLNRLKVNKLYLYLIGGVFMWYFMSLSGVHATISGVLLAFAIPFNKGENISEKLQHHLHRPVAFIILPIFALANTGIVLKENWTDSLFTNNSLGIFLGLVLGKPLGIILFCLLAVKMKIASLPVNVNWKQLFGAGILAGIGFTMAIFVSSLAFDDPELVQSSQVVVLISTAIATFLGAFWFLAIKK